MKSLTPMMQQYLQMKEKYSDCLLFFRLGDFYEMFFEDAKTAARELELVLTGRDCGLDERAPMCGVPYHSVDSYIARLISKGYKVAICEQLEDPALAKGLVERDVIRIITPGTVIEERMLDEHRSNYIAAICMDKSVIGVSYADVSTGEFNVFELSGQRALSQLSDELSRIQPTEVIISQAIRENQDAYNMLKRSYYVESYKEKAFGTQLAKSRLEQHFQVASLRGFGCEGLKCGIGAAGALMDYLLETQKNSLAHIDRLRTLDRTSYMPLDVASRRNLELTQPLQIGGSKKNTLLFLLDKTGTAMGSRLLRDWVDRPLIDRGAIERRLQAVDCLFQDFEMRNSLRSRLAGVYDIERLVSKIVYGTVNGRDCVSLRNTLQLIGPIKELTVGCGGVLAELSDTLDEMEDVSALLMDAIIDEPPIGVKDGDLIRAGYDQEVDELRSIRDNSRGWLDEYEQGERTKTGIKNLKVSYNHVFGYYIEVSKSFLSQVPYTYVRKQTLVNAERFITPELKEMEEKILTASDRLIQKEYELFMAVREVLLGAIERLQQNAYCLAVLDVLSGLAEVAVENDYVRPELSNDGVIHIINGRHPVVEQPLKGEFIPNDVLLDNEENRLLIITGPNMAGKSTYMRQTALIVLMAQMGSFVPATSARISIVDRIFTRIGASDDLSSGQSTFMVEMSEVANILNNATKDSLLILDEIGRGTSTFDGLSIAWAVLEYIASTSLCGAKALFATHYHELTELEGRIPGVKNYRVSVKEMGEDILFLRKIVRGSGDKSFGIQVAKLAGLPQGVLRRASDILRELEQADIAQGGTAERVQVVTGEKEIGDTPQGTDALTASIIQELKDIDIDHLTLVEALNQLYSLCTRVRALEE